MKICIPTKGRVSKITTQEQFNHEDIILFVEPQEFDEYKNAYKDIEVISIEDNNRGIGYSRNFIINFCRHRGYDKIIMSDDDLIKICKKEKNVCRQFEGRKTTTDGYVKIDAKLIIPYFEKLLDNYASCSIGMAGFDRMNESKTYINARAIFTFSGHNILKTKINYDVNNIPEEFKFSKWLNN